jgi:hypothetical protein
LVVAAPLVVTPAVPLVELPPLLEHAAARIDNTSTPAYRDRFTCVPSIRY